MNLVVLASGRGSNFAAIADAVADGRIPRSRVLALVCNRPQAPVVELARRRNVPVEIVDSGAFRRNGKLDRFRYEAELGRVLERLDPDYLCLAGYMLILGETLVRRWENRILNIHPSLLPKYPGLHPQRRALEAGDRKTGCTVHIVTPAVDDGPILAQGEVDILPGDTEHTLAARLLPVEHATYVRALARLAEIHVEKRGQ